MSHASEVLRPVLPAVADEVIATIAREISAYERPMEGLFGQMVRLGVETALRRFVDGPTEPGGDTYVNLGRGEYHAGRSLENLLAAYRIGARVTWRRFVEAGTAGGLAPAELFDIGEAIFAYIDTLSSESAEGYAAEAQAEAGERRRARWELVDALATGAEIPARADWEPRRELAALVVDPGEEDAADAADRLARDIGVGVVATARDGLVVAFVGDPAGPGRRALIDAAVAGRRAALGPTTEAPRSLRRALAALGPQGLVDADAELGRMLLRADPELAEELAASRLAPLAGADRLEPTLRAWLDRPGQIQAIAHDLGVHPQTVRYRVRQLRERFGTALDDPDARFELSLALRARH
jgi:hypothetical protein